MRKLFLASAALIALASVASAQVNQGIINYGGSAAQSSGGGGTPGGATNSVQYNNGGSFGGVGPGTATTLLHGNASGAPSFSAVDLNADVTGNLGVSHLNGGTGATASTVWCGNATWCSVGNATFGTTTGNTTDHFVSMANTTTGVKDSTYGPSSFAPPGSVSWLTSSNPTIDAAAWSKVSEYVIAGSGRTLTLPLSTGISSGGGIYVSTQESSVTLTATSTDTITWLGATTGAAGSVTLLKGSKYEVTTDGAGHFRVDNVPALNGANNWTGAQSNCFTTLTAVSNTYTPDGSCNNYSITLGATNTIANPSVMTPGTAGVLVVAQDATGGRTVTWGSQWVAAGGTSTLSLSSGANAIDYLSYIVKDSTHVFVGVAGLNASH